MGEPAPAEVIPRAAGRIGAVLRSNSSILLYVLWLAAAELSLVVGLLTGNPAWYSLGIFADLALVVVLVIHATWLRDPNPRVSAFLLALLLAPLTRVASLSAPLAPFPIIIFLLIIAFPLLFGVVGVALALGLRPADLYLRIGSVRSLAANAAVGVGGLGLGYIEFLILRPQPWISAFTPGALAFGGFVVLLSTGVAEELIFRGAIMHTAERLYGIRPGLLVATVAFTILHIGFLSPLDLAFVFGAGLYFGIAVQKTGSLYGAIAAHTLANAMLYLVLPFVLTIAIS